MALVMLETVHPGVLEAVKRLVGGENEVPTTGVRDFDANEYRLIFDAEADTLTIGVRHQLGTFNFFDDKANPQAALMRVRLESILEKRLAAALKGDTEAAKKAIAWLPTKDAPTGQKDGVCAVVVHNASKLTPETVDKHPILLEGAQLRTTVLAVPFFLAFDKVLAAKKADASTFPPMCVPYRVDESIYLYVNPANESIVAVMPIIAGCQDDALYLKTFLGEAEHARNTSAEAAYGPGLGVGKEGGEKPGTWPSGLAVREDTTKAKRTFWVSFNMAKSLFDKPEKQTKTVQNIVNFRAFIFYHIQCSKSHLHQKLRERTRNLEAVINRAKTKTTGLAQVTIE